MVSSARSENCVNEETQEAQEQCEITTNMKLCSRGRDVPADAVLQTTHAHRLQSFAPKNLDVQVNDNLCTPNV